jgi:hypothetical protein
LLARSLEEVLQERKKDRQRKMTLCDSLSNVGSKQQIPLPLCSESEVAFFVCCLFIAVTLVFRVSEAATLVRAAIAAFAFLRNKNKNKKRKRRSCRTNSNKSEERNCEKENKRRYPNAGGSGTLVA